MNLELQRQLKKEARRRKKEYDKSQRPDRWQLILIALIGAWVIMMILGVIKGFNAMVV